VSEEEEEEEDGVRPSLYVCTYLCGSEAVQLLSYTYLLHVYGLLERYCY
jgi:hypothetical protein